MPQTLGQVVATEKAARQRANKEAGDIHKLAQKVVVLSGLSRTYQPKDEEGQKLPPEGNIVQETIPDLIERFTAAFSPALDAAATKDFANCDAAASVKIEDAVILADVPVTHLLFLEHQLQEVRTFIGALVTLDPAETWTRNEQTGLWESRPSQTIRSEKHEVPLVLHAPTKEHPAQVKSTMQESAVGTWTSVRLSGAIPEARKRELLHRADALLDAVKVAREAANQQPAPRREVAEPIFRYLFA